MNLGSTLSSSTSLGGGSLVMNATASGGSGGSVADALVSDARRTTRGGGHTYEHSELSSAVIGELRRGGDAGALQDAIARRLPAHERARFEGSVNAQVERMERTDAALVLRAEGRAVPGARQVEAETAAIVEGATKSRTVGHRRDGPTTTQSLDTNALSYQLDRLSQRDPALAVGVKAELNRTLTDAQMTEVERTFAGGATPAEDARLAFEHPREGIEGAAKKAANAGLSASRVLPGDQNPTYYEMENRAQRGGGLVLEGASYAAGGPAALRVGAKGLTAARALAANRAVQANTVLGAGASGGLSVQGQMQEGATLGEALTSGRTIKDTFVGGATGTVLGATNSVKVAAAAGTVIGGTAEAYRQDFAGEALDYGKIAGSALDTGVGAAGGQVVGNAFEGLSAVGATAHRAAGKVLSGEGVKATARETAKEGLVDVSQDAGVQLGSAAVSAVPQFVMDQNDAMPTDMLNAIGKDDE